MHVFGNEIIEYVIYFILKKKKEYVVYFRNNNYKNDYYITLEFSVNILTVS